MQIGNSLILSTAGPTPLVTQAAGVMQSSIAVTQQPLPVFRQPAGVHLPHYPTNYIPYGHYYSPFYVPPPAIHQFLSNGAFPPQPQPASLYPAPPVATTKYPLSQYKSGNNTGNSTQMGVPGSYVPYGSSPSGFNTTPATTGNSASSDDLGASHFKENNVYITGQQVGYINFTSCFSLIIESVKNRFGSFTFYLCDLCTITVCYKKLSLSSRVPEST